MGGRVSSELERLRKAYSKLEQEIEKKNEELMNLKEQKETIGRRIDRKKKENQKGVEE
ncbi:MAG: hypothetical protein V5A88_10300 [Candidatus Thermoplasmatota archaeon]